MAEKFNIIQTAMASSERIFELLDTPEELPNPAHPVEITKLKGKVEYKGVWFAYKNDDYVLQNINFVLEPGESLAIVGATGSGKSTIINTLFRFYDVQKGGIYIDDIPLSEINKYDLRRQMALVQQDVFLFTRNVLDNIRLGNQCQGLEEVESIAHAVNSHHFIENLPMKYNQPLSERGNNLSLGQKQLLSFARALAFDPRILILDEATSNVDTETEKLIQSAVQKLIKGRTSIIIAHRLSTLKSVDKVLVLQQGKVQEFGKREDLLKQKGIYFNLVKLQVELSKGKSIL